MYSKGFTLWLAILSVETLVKQLSVALNSERAPSQFGDLPTFALIPRSVWGTGGTIAFSRTINKINLDHWLLCSISMLEGRTGARDQAPP